MILKPPWARYEAHSQSGAAFTYRYVSCSETEAQFRSGSFILSGSNDYVRRGPHPSRSGAAKYQNLVGSKIEHGVRSGPSLTPLDYIL